MLQAGNPTSNVYRGTRGPHKKQHAKVNNTVTTASTAQHSQEMWCRQTLKQLTLSKPLMTHLEKLSQEPVCFTRKEH